MSNSSLLEKERRSVKILRALAADETVEIAYSGGKDSDVILALAKEAGIKYRAIHKITTIDPPGTIAHALSNGCELVRPRNTFFQLIEKHGPPSMFRRHCCSTLKEYKIMDTVVLGIRRAESHKRAKRYTEPEQCRYYGKKEYVRQILPILEWTKEDVAEFVNANKIRCHSLYYDEDGCFHPERRLGCLGCPLAATRKRVEDFRRYPKLLRLWCRATRRWIDAPRKKPLKSMRYFNDEYEMMFFNLFCVSLEDFRLKAKGFFPLDCKKALEDMIGIELP